MTRWALVALLVGLVPGRFETGTGQAPMRPDFSGSWTLVPEASTTPRRVEWPSGSWGPWADPTFGQAFSARQDAGALSLVRIVGDTQVAVTTVYKLDGSSSGNLELKAETISTATWQGGNLDVVTRVADADPTLPANRLERLLWLDPAGRLVVETTNGTAPPYLTVYKHAGS
jgi:hypothetical protein